MSARRLLNVVHTMLIEAHGEEAVSDMLYPAPEFSEDRSTALIAMGGEVVNA